jgi:hypothetical protein
MFLAEFGLSPTEISDSVMLFAPRAVVFKPFASRDYQPSNEMACSEAEKSNVKHQY